MLASLHASSFPLPSFLPTSANSQLAALKSDDDFFAFNTSAGGVHGTLTETSRILKQQ